MVYTATFNENYLSHHGVKGMKWGVRRYQNKDGSLTPEGQKRYGSQEAYDSHRAANRDKAKKIAKGVGIGLGVAAVAVGAAYVYSKNSQKIKDTLSVGWLTSGIKALDKAELAVDKGPGLIKKVGEKVGKSAKDFASKEVKTLNKSFDNAIQTGSDALVKGAILAAVGGVTKKLSDKVGKGDSGNDSEVQKIIKSSVDKAMNEFTSSMSVTTTTSSKGKAVGKDVSKRLGSPSQEKYSPSDETRYQQIFKNDKVKNNVEVRQTVKNLRRQGYDVGQIEKYIGFAS